MTSVTKGGGWRTGLGVALFVASPRSGFSAYGMHLPLRAAPPPTSERMTAIVGRAHEVLAAAGHDADDLDLDNALAACGGL